MVVSSLTELQYNKSENRPPKLFRKRLSDGQVKDQKCLEKESFSCEIVEITYLERGRAKPFILQFGACLDTSFVTSLDYYVSV